ncbi:hypothetical protein [Photobacterium galatheae]|nr:hypothetical protein [Photobacterium galatheae]
MFMQVPLASAENEIDMSVSCPAPVEALYQPISQRIFLAMFGSEGSIHALNPLGLTDSQADVIREMTASERAACAAPMPVETANTIANTLRYLYGVTAVLWGVMVALYAFDSAYLSQNRNTEKSASAESPALKIIRSLVAVAITVPFMDFLLSPFMSEQAVQEKGESSIYDFSAVHQLMFRGIGKAIGTAEDIDAKLKKRYVASNPTYVIPAPDYPIDTASYGIMHSQNKISGILDFGLCVVFETNGVTPNFNHIQESVIQDDHAYKLRFTYKEGKADCTLLLEMKKDKETLHAVDTLSKNTALAFNMNYAQKESLLFTHLARALVDVSIGHAEGMLSIVSPDSPRILLDSKHNQSQAINKVIHNLQFWTEACPLTRGEAKAFASKYGKPTDSYKPTAASIADLRTLSEKCVAYLITAKLAYPKNFQGDFTDEASSVFGTKPLKFDAALLPSVDPESDSKFAYPEVKDARRLSGRQYQTCAYYTATGNNHSPEACLKTVCDLVDPTAPVSGIFECAVLIHVAKEAGLNNYYDSLGFVATPATILTRLGKGEVASAPQSLIYSFKANYAGDVSPEISLYDFYHDLTEIDLSDYSAHFKYTDYSNDGSDRQQQSPADEIVQCLITPSKVIKNEGIFGEAYFRVCEHPINEVHNFGMYLLKMYAGYLGGVSAKYGQGLFEKYKAKKSKIAQSSGPGTSGNEPGPKKKQKSSPKKDSKNETEAETTPWKRMMSFIMDRLLSAGTLVVGGSLLSVAIDGNSFAVPQFMAPLLGKTNEDTPYWSDPSGAFTTASVVAGFAMGYIVSGNIVLTDGEEPSKAEKAAIKRSANKTTSIGMLILSFGFIAAFIVPLIPAAIFYSAFISVIANLLAMVFSANFHIIYAFANTGSDIRKKLTALFNKWVLMILRIPLLVVGFYLTYSLMVTVLPAFAEVTHDILAMAGLNIKLFGLLDMSGFISMIMSYLLFLFFFMLMMFAIFDAITGPFELTRGLVFNDDSGEALGKTDSHSKIDQNMKLFKNI